MKIADSFIMHCDCSKRHKYPVFMIKYTDSITGEKVEYKRRGFKSKNEAIDAERRFLIERKEIETVNIIHAFSIKKPIEKRNGKIRVIL